MSMTNQGLNIELQKMEKLIQAGPAIAAQALYKGAGVLAAEYQKALAGMPTEANRFVQPGDPPRHATVAEKNVLLRSLGIAKFRKDPDSVDTSVGLNNSGYAENIRTEKYPGGKPVPLIANGINSGSSFIIKYPFKRMAEAAGVKKALAAADAEAQKLLDEVTNKNG